MQRLADIDIAEPGDDRLVEERRLQRHAFARAIACASRLASISAVERLDPERAEMAAALGGGRRNQRMKPNRRGSLKVATPPSDSRKTT